jgi:flagellar protein FliO/FliZ
MAQRLEAALRRPPKGGEARPAESAPRPAAINAEAAPTPPPARAPAAPEAATARAEVKPARSLYDSLEKEMANLLGRPGGKS